MTFFQQAGLPVDSVSLNDTRRNLDDYLVINLHVFPALEPSFNRTGVLALAFALIINQTFQPSKEFNVYFFIPEPYNFMLGNVCLYATTFDSVQSLSYIRIRVRHFAAIPGTRHKSSNTGMIIGSTIGVCMLVVLFVLAGIYTCRQKQRATQWSQPFGKYGHRITKFTNYIHISPNHV